jgi:hypothetical protein
LDVTRLQRTARDYGSVRTKKFFSRVLGASPAPHVV